MSALWMAGGVLVWAVHFGLIYAVVTLACAHGSPGPASAGVAGATLVALAANGALILHGYRARATFVGWMTAGLAFASAWAVLYEGIGVFFLAPCR
jgi:hypothetical protein